MRSRIRKKSFSASAQIPGFGADYSGSHCGRQVERVAHRKHPLAHFELFRIAHRQRSKSVCIYFYQRKVGHRVCTYERAFEFTLVIQGYGYLITAVYDMVVGHYISVIRYYHS